MTRMSAEESLGRAEELLARLEAARARLETTEDPDLAIEVLQELAELAKQIEAELHRARRAAEAGCRERLTRYARSSRRISTSSRSTPELGSLGEPMRHCARRQARPAGALPRGGRGGRRDVDAVLPAAAAVELVHSFSLVHDDLPALDDDAERRGRPSVWAAYGEATAILAGDALVAEAFRLALSYPTPGGRARARRRDARR